MSARNRQPKSQSDAFARTLRTLVKQPDNKVCADCKRNDPRWASWNLGVYLCIRCSGFHRAMGTHISRVKSIDLDVWTPEQMDQIQKWGNARANKYWEHNLKPGHVPPEHKIEAFIRSKYELRRWAMKSPIPEDPSVLDDKTPTTNEAVASVVSPVSVQSPVSPGTSTASAGAASRRPMPPPAPAINLIDDDDASVASGVSTAAASITALPGDGLQSRLSPADTPTPSVPTTPLATHAAPAAPTAASSSTGGGSGGGGGGLFDEDWDTPVAAPAPAPAAAGSVTPAQTNVKANIMSLFNTAPSSFNQAPPPNSVSEPPIGTWGLTAEPNPWAASAAPAAPAPGGARTPGTWSTMSNSGATTASSVASPGLSDLWGSSAPSPAPASTGSTAAPPKKDPFADIWN